MKKKIFVSSMASMMMLSMACVPAFAAELTTTQIIANSRVGDGQREVTSFEITVNDESLITDLDASDFDIKNNSSTIPFDAVNNGWAKEYEDDGITLTIEGKTIKMEVEPFCYAGMYADGTFSRVAWEVECASHPELSFDVTDVTELKTDILDDAIRGTFTYAGLTREYALYLPKNADGTTKTNVPLVVWNHGGGEYNGSLEATLVANKGLTAWPEAGYDTAVLQMQVANPNYSYGTAENEEKKSLIDQNNALQAALIKQLISEGKVDQNRVYVTGASSGGGATMRFVMQYPELFAGAIACCSMDPIVPVHNQTFAVLGREKDPYATIVSNFEAAFKGNVYTWDEAQGKMVSKTVDTQTLLNVPIYFTHAQNDPTCSVDSSKAMYEAMNNLGDTNNQLTIWSNEDMEADGIDSDTSGGALLHWSWVKLFNHNEAGSPMNWLFSQTKENVALENEEPVIPQDAAVQSVKTGDDSAIMALTTSLVLAGCLFVAMKKYAR